jgi:hypothetical protein
VPPNGLEICPGTFRLARRNARYRTLQTRARKDCGFKPPASHAAVDGFSTRAVEVSQCSWKV